jgi:oligopeptide/dipeptide ABC transporter ATP-binding protein
MGSPLLSISELRVQFETPWGRLHAVNHISLEIHEQEAYGIVGESGSGKSVTALTVMRLLPPAGQVSSGSVLFKGQDLLKMSESEMRRLRGKEISLIFQDPQASLDPVFTIADQIAEAITIHQRVNPVDLDRRVIDLLTSVGIPEPEIRKNQYPHQFSGGMKQRAMSAIALANNPSLIIADEPTTSLDVTIQAQIIDLLHRLKSERGVSILLITHDMGLVAELCDRVSVMYAGYIVESADVHSIFERPRHPYTRGLIGSIPRLDMDVEELVSIHGRVPDPLNLPPHCVFLPRCLYAQDVCKSGIPELMEVDQGTKVACFLAERGAL